MPEAHADGSQRVLVVDDTPQNLRLVEANLTGAGYAVTLAESGSKALALFESMQPDLVLLDLLMPDMDGFETISRLRNLAGGPETPVVFLTAQNDSATHARALDSGADDFLTKPINRIELLLRVRSLVRFKRIHNELTRREALITSQRDALLAAQRQKEALTGFIVHDLKNPLMGILANAQFVARESGLPDAQRKSVHDILSAGESLHRMIMNLVDISRSQDGALVPVLEEFDLAALLEEVSRMNARRAESRKQSIEVNLRLANPMIRADRDLIRRLLENLMDNAIRFSPREASIGISAVRREHSVEVRVRDTGPGVPESSRAAIFEKTAALDPESGGQARAGRAMGLAFCAIAAQAHGGRIWVEDNVPSGSVFCFDLPGSS